MTLPLLSSENMPPLSISWKDIGLSEIVYSGMWSKAAELVADKAARVAANCRKVPISGGKISKTTTI